MERNMFEALMREILRHQQIMVHLQEENRELRRQLADLQEARGIYLDIGGKRFVLTREWTAPPALISSHTPSPTFLEERLREPPAAPSADFLSKELAATRSVPHKQRTKEGEQKALQGQLVDSFLLD